MKPTDICPLYHERHDLDVCKRWVCNQTDIRSRTSNTDDWQFKIVQSSPYVVNQLNSRPK